MSCLNAARSFASEYCSIYHETFVYIQILIQKAQPKPLDKRSPKILVTAKTQQVIEQQNHYFTYHLQIITPQLSISVLASSKEYLSFSLLTPSFSH